MLLVIGNNKRLYGLTADQKDKVKEHLTFDNPAYKSAKRYSRRKVTRIPPYLKYYNTGSDDLGSYIEFPMGFNHEEVLDYHINPVANKDDSIFREEINTKVKFPDFVLDLRPIQSEAAEAYRQEQLKLYDKSTLGSCPRSLISLPTGKGKTILACYIAASMGVKTLVLVHKDDLVKGWQNDINLCFGGKVKPGLIKAKSRVVGEHMTIATVQTLHKMSEEDFSKYRKTFGLVIQDEVHHVGLNMFNIVDAFQCQHRLGLTATPKRADGLDFVFDLFFGGICYEYKAGKDDEDISNVRVEVLESGFNYRPFIHKGEVFNYYDFDPKELPKNIIFQEDIPYKERTPIPFNTIDNLAVMSPKTRVRVCKKIVEHYRAGHSCIVLFTQKEHINSYYRYLKTLVPAEHLMLYYGDNKEDSGVLMQKAESKEVLITLATYAKATESTNVKAWEVAFLVSSMNNEKNVEQATGRIRRKKDGKLDPVIVYDIRYQNCYSLTSHYSTRLRVYNELEYEVHDPYRPTPKRGDRRSVFSRGYRKH